MGKVTKKEFSLNELILEEHCGCLFVLGASVLFDGSK